MADEDDTRDVILRNIEAVVRQHTVWTPCLVAKQTGPLSMGTLAFNVCGLRCGHEGPHRAGWTGYGEKWEI